MTEILKTKNLTKTYQMNGSSVAALNGVDIDVAKGEFLAIMGPSGSGKSTLLHMLGGLDRPSKGEVHFRGVRTDLLSEAKLATLRRQHVGYVFQFFNLIGNLTAADNVELPALMAGIAPAEARSRGEETLSRLGIADQARSLPAQMSGGQRQRVALARALVNEPAVLLADEPTGNLDSDSTRDVLGLLRQTNKAGQTIVVVTHDPNVGSVADRVVRMRDGRIVAETHLEDAADPRGRMSQLINLEMGT